MQLQNYHFFHHKSLKHVEWRVGHIILHNHSLYVIWKIPKHSCIYVSVCKTPRKDDIFDEICCVLDGTTINWQFGNNKTFAYCTNFYYQLNWYWFCSYNPFYPKNIKNDTFFQFITKPCSHQKYITFERWLRFRF